MKFYRPTRRTQAGFTLIELLAVIAIIGILASIVVPNVSRYIAKANVAKAVSEVRNAETALAGMLSDAGRSNFKDFLIIQRNTDPAADCLDPGTCLGLSQLTGLHIAIRDANGLNNTATALRNALDFYNEMFYELLRQGSDSDWVIANVDPRVRNKLGTTYLDLGNDSWGNPYQFWMGAVPRGLNLNILRSYRVDPVGLPPNDPDFTDEDAYRWNAQTRNAANAELPGQPRHDDVAYLDTTDGLGVNAYGYPAPKDLPVYIFSRGANLQIDAILPIQLSENSDFPEFYGGGDDPNSWDNASGWEDAPR